jgi:hypothetical protein
VRHGGFGRPERSRLDHSDHAVAIDAEILVAALRDDHLVAGVEHQAGRRKRPHRVRVEALVSNVDQRHEAALDDHVHDLAPLIFGKVAGQLWQQPWSKATSPGSALRAPQSSLRSGSRPAALM